MLREVFWLFRDLSNYFCLSAIPRSFLIRLCLLAFMMCSYCNETLLFYPKLDVDPEKVYPPSCHRIAINRFLHFRAVRHYCYHHGINLVEGWVHRKQTNTSKWRILLPATGIKCHDMHINSKSETKYGVCAIIILIGLQIWTIRAWVLPKLGWQSAEDEINSSPLDVKYFLDILHISFNVKCTTPFSFKQLTCTTSHTRTDSWYIKQLHI